MSEFSSLEMFVSFFVILITIAVYRKVIRPYRTYVFYKRLLTEHYRTEINPYSLLGVDNLSKKKEQLQKYNDSHHYAKTQLVNYQVRLMKVGSSILLDLIDPELIREFFEKGKEKYYRKKLDYPSSSSLQQIIGEGLLLSEGESWKKKRKILSYVFNFDFIHSKVRAIADIASKALLEVQGLGQNAGKGEIAVSIPHLFQKIFGNVVIKCFFGEIELEPLNGEDIFEFIDKMLELNQRRWQTPLAFLLGKNFYKYGLRSIDREVTKRAEYFFAYSEQLIKKIMLRIEKAQQDSSSKEKLGIIEWIIKNNLLSSDEREESQKYTMHQLISEVATFFLAGSETTATMCTMLLYTLSKHKKILDKLRAEIKEVFSSDGVEDITEQTLKKCVYLDCVIRQTLRMHSPASNIGVRQVVREHYLGSIPMKKGIQVGVKIVTNHYKDQFYSNPLEFNPNRWANVDVYKSPPFSYFPFSGGHRVCIGQHLSLFEAKIALIVLLKKYKVIRLQKENFKLKERVVYGPEPLTSFLTKEE